jgi:hypothetical protein
MSDKNNWWIKGEPFDVTQDRLNQFKDVKKVISCKLCGHEFKPGDKGRWIYCNGTEGQATGNFFTCSKCDGPDVMERAKEQLALAIKLAKHWGLYP